MVQHMVFIMTRHEILEYGVQSMSWVPHGYDTGWDTVCRMTTHDATQGMAQYCA